MGWYETGKTEITLYRFILFGYIVSESGDVIAYRFGLLRVNRGESRSVNNGTEEWISQYNLDGFLREHDSLVLKRTKEMLSDGSFRWRVPAYNRDIKLVKEGRATLVFTGSSSPTFCFYLLNETGKFVYKGFEGVDAQKIKEQLFNGEMDIADDGLVLDEYKRFVTLGEEHRRLNGTEIARDALTKRNISEIYLSEEGELCARGLKGVSNGVNSYPSFVRGITVSARTLYDSKTEVLDMSKCAGLKSFELYEAEKAYRKTLPSLSLIFPKELREDLSCHIRLTVESEGLNIINFPKGAVFNKLCVTDGKIAGIDRTVKVETCYIRDCTGLTELSIEVIEKEDIYQGLTLFSLDTVKLSVTVVSFKYLDIELICLDFLKEFRLTVSGEETKLCQLTSQHIGFDMGVDGLEALVLESKEGFVFGGCADFASVYSSLKRLEIRGDIAFGNNAEDEVVFVPRGCKVVCNNAEFIKHVRER